MFDNSLKKMSEGNLLMSFGGILCEHFHFQSGGGETTTNASIPRPSEIFYNKLTPILKDLYKDKLDQVDLMNRKLWSTTTLLQVLSELLRETPKDLLARYYT